MPPERIYRVLVPVEWQAMQEAGTYRGSALDLRDGFIHLSAEDQVSGTIARYFANEPELTVLEIDAAVLGERLRWEPSHDGMLFPHLYAELPLSAVVGVHRKAWTRRTRRTRR